MERSPGFAPEAAQATTLLRSSVVSRRSFSNVPKAGWANHGGMRPSATTSEIISAREATSS